MKRVNVRKHGVLSQDRGELRHGQTKECFCDAAPPSRGDRAVSVATNGCEPRIDIARDLGLRAPRAGHLPTSTPRARVYITRHPHTPQPIHPRRLPPTKQTSLVRACNMRKEPELRLGPSSSSAQIALIFYAVHRHVESKGTRIQSPLHYIKAHVHHSQSR